MLADKLTESAIFNGTDKFGYHDYTPKYYRILKHLEKKPMQVLEIGVGGYQNPMAGGESLEAWRDFFTESNIIGFDLHEKTLDLGERITVLQGSQIDFGFLDSTTKNYGPFEVIIDDGSHVCDHVIKTFNHLFPTLMSGGIYIIEDLQTAFKPSFGGSSDLNHPNHVGYFADVTRALHRNEPSNQFPFLSDVVGAERFHSMVVLYKKGGDHVEDPYYNILLHKGVETPRILVLGQKTTCTIEGDIQYYDGDLTDADAFAQLLSDQDPFDLVIDGAGTDVDAHDRFETLFLALPDGTSYVVEGANSQSEVYFHHLFAQLDHVAIAGFYPEVDINPLAQCVVSVEGYPGIIALQKGLNTYPSTFNFASFKSDPPNPQFHKNLDTARDVLRINASERGLCHHLLLAMRVGRTDIVDFMVERLDQIGRETPEAHVLSVQRLMQTKQLGHAERIAKAGRKRHPADANIWRISGQVALLKKNHKTAVKYLEQAIKIAPKQSMTYSLLITALRGAGNYKRAWEVAEAVTKIAPRDWKGWFALGQMMAQKKDVDGAIEAYEKANHLRPGYYAALTVTLAQLYVTKKRISDARKVVRAGLLADPDNVKLLTLSTRIDS